MPFMLEAVVSRVVVKSVAPLGLKTLASRSFPGVSPLAIEFHPVGAPEGRDANYKAMTGY